MRRWIPAVLIAAGLVFSAIVYPRLPATMTTHWGLNGQPNGFSPRAVGAFLLPGISILMWLVFQAIPRIDPRRANIARFRETFDLFVITIIGVLMVLHVAVVGAALGWPIELSRVAPVLVGALFIAMGNLLPRLRSNFFLGIRTPWTLSSETVWTRTHRLGGYLFVLMGLLIIALAFVQSAPFAFILIGAVASLILFLVVYSYVLWRSETTRNG